MTELEYTLVNEGPLHIGAQEGELLIDDSGRAVIPGTSLAGSMRHYAEDRGINLELIDKLFGTERESNPKESSALIVCDARSDVTSIPIEARPGVRINGRFGSVDGRGKFERIFIPNGITFHGKLVWTSEDEDTHTQFDEIILQCLRALDQGIIRLGRYKSSGGGHVRVVSAQSRTYDLENPEQLFQFIESSLLEGSSMEHADKFWLERIRDEGHSDTYRFEMGIDLSQPLLVRGSGRHDHNEPDASPIRRMDGKYIIPGSSWRGTLRHQVHRILDYLDKRDLEEIAFGAASKDEHRTGVVQVWDAVIDPNDSLQRQEIDYYGIRIDKFTGGVRSMALKRERTIRGKAVLRLNIHPSAKQSDARAIAGLLVLALRDLAEQGFSLGSGSGTGRGFVAGQYLHIRSPEGDVGIDFSKQEVSNPDILQLWLTALEQWLPPEAHREEPSMGRRKHGTVAG